MKKIKLNWGISMLIVYSMFALSMVIFAVVASKEKNELVTENYYDEAVRFQDRIDENANSQSAATKLGMNYDAGNRSLKLSVTGVMQPLSGKIFFYKPDRASNDFNVDFNTGEKGLQEIALTNIARGHWKISAQYSVDGKNCLEEKRIFIP